MEPEQGETAVKSKNRFYFYLFLFLLLSVLSPGINLDPWFGEKSDGAKLTNFRLEKLREYLYAYKEDLGFFPFTEETVSKENLTLADENCLSTFGNRNVLYCQKVPLPFKNLGLGNYGKIWKGPYAIFPLENVMLDAWGRKIKYVALMNGPNLEIWLQSAGFDGNYDQMDRPEGPRSSSYEGDDLALCLGRI